jgi:tetratricopeptide (TPR) repeat protein
MTADEKKEAKTKLLKAFAEDPTSAGILTNLGVLCAREKAFKTAIRYFSDGLRMNPGDLNIWSNLAEASLKAALEEKADPGLKEIAEKEFKRILEIAPNHVESIIGLGEVYKAMGDVTKDEDLYLRAIELFLQGIRIADSDVGSKKLKRKELAAAYYSIGYSKVKLYEATKPRGDSLLHEARDYFTMSFNDDPENYKAKRAVEKLDKRLVLSSSGLVDTFGPWLIFLAAISIFVGTQTMVMGKQEPFKDLEAGYYVLLSFGSLLFAIAGLYLPQLLKLKVAGIELEKNAVDQIATPGGLGISK